MKVEDFIKEYLSQCDDTVVCLHTPTNSTKTTFSIYEWHQEFIVKANDGYHNGVLRDIGLEYEIGQIIPRIENFNHGLNIVIHIYTKGVEEALK